MPAPPAGAVTPVASVPSCAARAGSGSDAAATGTGLAALVGVATPDATVIPRCATTVFPFVSFTGVEIGTFVVPSEPLTTDRLLPAAIPQNTPAKVAASIGTAVVPD